MMISNLQALGTGNKNPVYPMNKKNGPPPVVSKSLLAEKLNICIHTLRRRYLTDEFYKKLGYPKSAKHRTQFYKYLDDSFFAWLESLDLDW